MLIHRCDITMHDYLFFATTERGKVAETGPFLHNYTLAYAFGWALSPWRNEEQKPHYREELLGEGAQGRSQAMGMRYITPARLLRGSTVVQQYNSMGESYSLEKGRSIGFPEWGFMKCFRPGSLFRCYVLSADPVQIPRYVRLGKLMSKAAIHTVAASQLDTRKEAQSFLQVGSPLLTWNDLVASARPMIYDLFANSFPSRLIENAVFDDVPGSYLVATFPDNVHVQFPLQMGYYGEQLCASW